MAAVLACDGVLSHRSAACLWGLGKGESEEIAVTRPVGWRGRDGLRVVCASVPADERAVRDGIPVTTVPRTILDLAAVGRRGEVERAIHEAEVQQLTDPLSVPDLLERYPRRPGTRLLRELFGARAVADGVPANRIEERFRALIERHRLPQPRFNAHLAVRGHIFKPDCLWPERNLIVELDGRGAHATRRAFERDRERDRVLIAAGWRVIRVTWLQLEADEDAIVTDVRDAMALPA